MKKTIESNRQIKAQERQQTAFKHRIKEWCVRMLILLFWILMGL